MEAAAVLLRDEFLITTAGWIAEPVAKHAWLDALAENMTLDSFDLRVVMFCAVTVLTVGLLFGLAPAWQATAFAPAQALSSGSRTTTERSGRLRGTLVAAQVATAVLLLFGAGLFFRTLLVVSNVDRGYKAESVLTTMVDPLGSQYPTPEKLLQF